MRTKTLPALAAMLLACTLVSAASGTTYYVRKTGSDSNSGKSKTKAFKTITKAMSVAKSSDTVWIGAGTYSEQMSPVNNGKSASKPLKIYGDPTGVKTGDAGTITVTYSGGIVANITKNYISLRDLTISGGTDGVRWSGTSGLMQTVIVTGSSDDGIEMTSGSMTATSVTVQSSTDCGVVLSGAATLTWNTGIVKSCAGQGLSVTSASATATAKRSLFYNTTGRGVDMTAGNVTLQNCVIYDNTAGNIRADGTSTSTLKVQNCTVVGGANCIELRGITSTVQNVIMATSGTGILRIGASPATTLTHNNNLYWGLTTDLSGWGHAGTDVMANPSFMNAAGKDFNIGGASAAYNTGATISGLTVDYLNRARPALGAYDIGAYEGQTPAPAVPYFTDFETGSPGAEWSTTNTTTNATLSKFLGRFSNEQQSFRVATTVGQDYTLLFDAYVLDSWEGDSATSGPDTFAVYVGSTKALDETFSNSPDTVGNEFGYPGWPQLWSTNLSAGGAGRDQAMRSIVVRFTATSSESVIAFEGSGLQSLADESWGVDNVRVVARANESQYLPRFTEVGYGAEWCVFPGGGATPILFGDTCASGLQDSLVGGPSLISFMSNEDNDTWLAIPISSGMIAGALMDYDNNGSIELWRNASGSTFGASRWSSSGWVSLTAPGTISGVSGCETMAAADMNHDGYCDLILLGTSGNHVALNNGPNGSDTYTGFTMSTSVLPQTVTDRGDGDNCTIGDVNNDGFPDVFYHYNGGRLFLSDSSGVYASNALGISVATGSSSKMGSAFGDYDNDGDLDLFVGRRSGGRPYLWRNAGAGVSFADVAGANGLQTLTGVTSAAWGDYDNDGDLDLAYLTLAGQAGIASNSGSPSYAFSLVTEGIDTETRAGDIAFVDYDNDGDLDLAFTSDQTTHPALLFRNNGTEYANSMRVRVVGAGHNGINTAGIGSRVELWDSTNTTLLQRRDVGLSQGFGGQSSLWPHFGGINPAATYTVRVYNNSSALVATVVPALASTGFNNGVDLPLSVARLLTVAETEVAPTVQITRWREVTGEE